jgi:uncharacterized membrane protein (UPF0182 family)
MNDNPMIRTILDGYLADRKGHARSYDTLDVACKALRRHLGDLEPAYGDHVVMEETLPAALAALFKESVPVAALAVRAGASPAGPADERARTALTHYDRAIDRLKVGDWGGFGAELDAMRPLLEELSRVPASH